jgi:hypothetical protein
MVHVSLARPSLEIFSSAHPVLARSMVAARVDREVRAGSHEGRRERKLSSMVDDLGSVQSGACIRCTQSEKYTSPAGSHRFAKPEPAAHHSLYFTPYLVSQHVSNLDPGCSRLSWSSTPRTTLPYLYLNTLVATARRRRLIKVLIVLSHDQGRRPLRARAALPATAWLGR